MNNNSLTATGLRSNGIMNSLDDLIKNLDRLDEVIGELRQKTEPLRVNTPIDVSPPVGGSVATHERCHVDERIASANFNIRNAIARIESTYEEIKL